MKKITSLLLLALISLTGLSQNNSLNFDGVNDYVNVGDNFAFDHTDAFSVEAWIKFDQGGVQQIISKLGTESGNYRGWGFQTNNAGYISGYVVTAWGVNIRYVRGTTLIFDGIWHHVAMTFDGADTITLYLDGALEPNGFEDLAGTLTDIQTTAETHIGNFDDNGNQAEFFTGNIEELRVWEGVRTLAEIQANYQTELSGTEANLIGYYKFDDSASGCDVLDCSPSEAHGERFGAGGPNNLPQFDPEAPVITDVACGASNSCTFGIDDNNQLAITLLPNPTQGPLTITGQDVTNATVIIYNVLGNVVETMKLQNNNLDISSIASGIYFIEINMDGNRMVKKLIKK